MMNIKKEIKYLNIKACVHLCLKFILIIYVLNLLSFLSVSFLPAVFFSVGLSWK